MRLSKTGGANNDSAARQKNYFGKRFAISRSGLCRQKRQGGGNAVPRKGSSASSGEEKKLDEHEWDDIKDICKDRATKATVKK